MFDITTEIGRDQLAEKIKNDIEAACVELYSEGSRAHLGGSIIGEPCSRKLYYGFRWCFFEAFNGRMLRLFNVGHREEERFILYLRKIGFLVLDKEPGTEKQFRIEGAKGHFGGSLDSVAKPTFEGAYASLGNYSFLCEYKTYNSKRFCKLALSNVAQHSPKYYAQICTYGRKRGYQFCIFLAINKDDSDIYCEIIPIDNNYGEVLEIKAHEVIFAKQPPPRISENSADYECAYCAARGICFHNQPVLKNCRSCQHSEPVDNAEWHCHLHKANIPKDFIPNGCEQHQGIVSP